MSVQEEEDETNAIQRKTQQDEYPLLFSSQRQPLQYYIQKHKFKIAFSTTCFVFVIFGILLIALVSISIALLITLYNNPSEPISPIEENVVLNFIVMGGFGNKNSDTQRQMARIMSDFCTQFKQQKQGCDFVMTTGNNFLDKGVVNEDDLHWFSSFETPYRMEGFKQCPFVAALGAKDYRQNIDSQVEYTHHFYPSFDPDFNNRWYLSHHYYQYIFCKNLGAGKESLCAQFLFLDTTPFLYDLYNSSSKVSEIGYTVNQTALYRNKNITEQLQYLEQEVTLIPLVKEDVSKTSLQQVHYRFLIGNHGLFNADSSLNEQDYFTPLRNALTSLIQKHSILAYFSGQTEQLQYIKKESPLVDPIRSSPLIHHFVSGSAVKTSGTVNQQYSNLQYAYQEAPGFLFVSLGLKTLTVKFVNINGQVKQVQTIANPFFGKY